MESAAISARLMDLLGLRQPPVCLTFTDEPPAGVTESTRAVPSACSFWREAERGLFYASAEQHFNCPVGAMVMGFELPEGVMQDLGGLVESMCSKGYLTPDEPAKIPSVQRRSAGIVYGPLAEFAAIPDVILLWLTPQQAMLFTEAAGRADWTGPLMPVSGRPGCAALPAALGHAQPALSLGCAGMRTFTAISGDSMLGVVPGNHAEQFVTALERMADVNTQMRAYYEAQASQLN